MDKLLAMQIEKLLTSARTNGMTRSALYSACKINKQKKSAFKECMSALEKKGRIIIKNDKAFLTTSLDVVPAVVSSVNKTFGFASSLDDGGEMFIPGRFLLGALPGDHVLVSKSDNGGISPEGEILKITKPCDCRFSGSLSVINGEYFVLCDSIFPRPMPLDRSLMTGAGAQDGDKVICRVKKRGTSHMDHTIEIIASYGSKEIAANCATAILEGSGVPISFSNEAIAEAEAINRKGISEREIAGRLDLRAEAIFTIDGADTKDIDDAVSIKKLGDCYALSVHIADVSYYVKTTSEIEKEAFERGTSIYFADRVIPMLPKALSNGICSLNPNEDRLAFSCLMTISLDGELMDFDFQKTVIRSRIKGVYSEINEILNNNADEEITEKYAPVKANIFLMKELADILTQNKTARGAPDIETSESKIVLNDKNIASDVVPRERGESEVIIEEFMLMANQAAATAARLKEIPFVYRVHEPPSEEKLTTLSALLETLGLPTKSIRPNMPTKVLAKLLRKSKGEKYYHIVSLAVLRSMSKAKYYEIPLGHYGLVLENYAQFTSPIRRYPDLTIHRILSEVVKGTPLPKVRSMFEKEAVRSSRRSTETELAAMKLERSCDDCYLAEYMKAHIGEEFDGVISSIAVNRIFVELPNTVEGCIGILSDDMPKGEYDFDGMFTLTETGSGKKYRIGDSIRVCCVSVDISQGRINFAYVQKEQ